MLNFAAELRHNLRERNVVERAGVRRCESRGGVTLYLPSEDGKRHGNFIDASYRSTLKNPAWAARLQKAHTAKGTALPAHPDGGEWRELDSCMSSDALLMNVFCYPGVCDRAAVTRMLGVAAGLTPEFGYKARVPLAGDHADRTEVDMRLGTSDNGNGLLVEAKLTESDFQAQTSSVVERYRDLAKVFDVRKLPRVDGKYASYQLIRNILAAYATCASFCVLVDLRRPDLIERFGEIASCVRDAAMWAQCKLLTWQELAPALPAALQLFIKTKYGIVELWQAAARA